MTRGSNRQDVPLPAIGEEIGRDCPVENWEYWESETRFSQVFSTALRKEIALALADLRSYRRAYDQPTEPRGGMRLDPKQIKRDLKKAIREGAYPSETIERFVVIHSMDIPSATVSERAGYVLSEFSDAPEDFLVERPAPNPLFTRVFYELFHRHGLNVSLGSSGTLYEEGGMSKKARAKAAPETPFVEFARRCIWETSNSSASFCARVRKEIQRCAICSKL